MGLYLTLVAGWTFVAMIVSLGPLYIEDSNRGPYFGVVGPWCWITDQYPLQQTFMEYFYEFLSAGLGFSLYSLVLLRVRGNLVKVEGKWTLRWISNKQAWKLSFNRDLIDSAMLRVATSMVWYPVAYSVLIIPVALARMSSFSGHHVPFWATITTDFIFNLTGLINTILFLTTRKILPDTASLPQFDIPRHSGVSESRTKFGITPFTLPKIPETLEGSLLDPVEAARPKDIESNSYKGPDIFEDISEDLGPPVRHREETHTYGGGIVVPVLKFS